MSDPLRQRLLEQMKEFKTNATRLSLAIGRDGTFIRDFINGKKSGFSSADMMAIERELGIPQGELSLLAARDEPVVSIPEHIPNPVQSPIPTHAPAHERKPILLAGTGGGETKIEPLSDGTFRVRADLIISSDQLADVIRFLAEYSS